MTEKPSRATSAPNGTAPSDGGSVPPIAVQAREGISRRSAMNVMSAIAAVPALGMPSGALALVTTDRSDWNAALATFRRANQMSESLYAAHYAAEEAWGAVCPHEDRFFDEYRLGIGMKRDRVIRQLRWYADLNKVEMNERAIADEFMAYQERHAETKRAYRVEETWERARAHDKQHYFPAREALMSLPAPDEAALLVKMEISTRSLDDEHAESTLADARRLLGGGEA